MGEHVALIVNPAATRVDRRALARIIAALSPLGLRETSLTERRGHCASLAVEAADAGASVVVVAGGDGTVHEAAGALAGTGVALAPLSVGSTNVFARAVGWPQAPRHALRALVESLRHPVWRDVTLGRVVTEAEERVFCINAGIGLDADTVHRVESHPWMKTRLRHAGFAAAALAAASRAALGAPTLVVEADGQSIEVTTLIVTVGSPYAFLGPRALDVAPGADFDGRLRWFALRSANPLLAARAVRGALAGGSHLAQRGIALGWASAEIRVESDRPAPLQADGEPFGWHRRVRFTPGPVLRILAPGSPHRRSAGPVP